MHRYIYLRIFLKYWYITIITSYFSFVYSCRLVVDWQLSRHDTGKPVSKEPDQVPNTEDKYDQADDSGSDQETSYIKTRSGRNAKMAQKKDQ